MRRVEVTKPFCNLYTMQVCAVEDATEEEILEVCNTENPSGTSQGWCSVDKTDSDSGPVACDKHKGRVHYLVYC